MLKKGFLVMAMLASTLVMVPVKSSSETYGPILDKFILKVVTHEDAQWTAITTRGLDIMGPVTSPDIIRKALAAGKYVSSRPAYNWFRFLFNYRRWDPAAGWVPRVPLCDVNFRHALLHLLKTNYILGTIYQFTYDSLDSVVPRAYGEWYNPNVEKHLYSSTEARNILTAAGYIFSPGKNNWVMPYDYDGDGTLGTRWTGSAWTITDLDDVVPNRSVAVPSDIDPQKMEAAQSWVNEMNSIGLSSISLEVVIIAESQEELLEGIPEEEGFESGPSPQSVFDYKVYWMWNYDIAIDTLDSLGPDVSYLYLRFHSSQNYWQGSYNPTGMLWDAPGGVDDQINTIMTDPDKPDQVTACWRLQELLIGGSVTSPMPAPSAANGWLRNDDWWQWSIPNALVASRINYYITQPELKGLVNSMGYSYVNKWTDLTMYWATADGNRPGTTEKSCIWLVKDYGCGLNPAYYWTKYDGPFLERIFDPLVATNPYTLQWEPWLATHWGKEPWGTGIKYWYKIRPGLKWQDGYDYTAEDVKFNWDFIKYWEIPKWWAQMYMVDHTAVETTGPAGPGDYAVIYIKEPNVWMQKMFGWLADKFPPQIYDRNWGTLGNLEMYNPEFTPYKTENMAPGYAPGTMPDGATNLFGTGPWILVGLDPYYAWAEYVANRNYFLSQTYVAQRLSYLFWRVGDTTKN